MERNGQSLDLEVTSEAMVPHVESGFTTFDMADHYGSAEVIAGLYRKRHASDVELLTKWVPTPGPCSREEVRSAVKRALERMQTDKLDLLQYHTWNYADPSWLDTLYWLQELKGEGLIRYLGLVNVDTAHLGMALHTGFEIVSNQVCFSLLDQRAKAGMTELCQEHGIKLLAFGTVAGGFLTERWLGKPEPNMDGLETWSEMKYKRFIDTAGGWRLFQDVLQTIKDIAVKHSVSIANIACRYILEEPAVAGIIIGARLGKSEHIQDNHRLFEFSLDESSRTEIAEALAKLRPIPGDCGDEYRKPPYLTAAGDLSHHIESIPPPYKARSIGDGRTIVLSGTRWEDMAGFSRAVRHGDRILVSGTTATHGNRVIGGRDPAAQTHFVIDKIDGAIQSFGGQLEDVIRTRVYVRNISDWEAVARVHGQRFSSIQPANTLVQANLVGKEYLVEMEAEAVLSSRLT
jgi:aryl-alcohol dehydrogenase-like predicted oxidoreductase/enamine deaminase RidA (YjgF/YER057c/UK114 family)